MRIYLTGFMGAGKSTVGRLLAQRLGSAFVDLDAEIERRAGASVREIFEQRGEAAFRGLERQCLEETFGAERVVVATGGGTLAAPANLESARARGLVVWIHPPFATIVGRIGGLGKSDRPLFRDEKEALELYRRRLPTYRRADLTVEVSPEESAEEVAARLVLTLSERACST
ncbi:MAG: shikimate kinase [Acidobacteria bacterium]|nr:shikimate kinase [Acidobacteriota bacterium]